MNGLDVLARLKKEYPDIEVIMISGHGDIDSVIKAMHLGASDYFSKPFKVSEILSAVERTKRFIALTKKLKETEHKFTVVSDELQNQTGFKIIGSSPQIRNVIKLMKKIAETDDTSVLILGESGTGKDLVARGIHYFSSRKNKAFYPINCPAIPDNLFESEFFGHKKGAFTGAIEDKTGCFEMANNGTLLLDEITEMPFNLQAKLLRIIEDKKVKRIGCHREIPVNVRVIAASNQNIEKLINENKFRKDLYYRLNSFVIKIPPLREHKEDIPLLLDYFLHHFSKKLKKDILQIDNKVVDKLIDYSFPGNIRELKNIVERAVILCDSKTLHLKVDIEEERSYDLELVEKKLIQEALEKTNYKKSEAIKLLNISRHSLDGRIKKYDL
jgi:DNA-binding NtrC family response regulator